MRWLLGALAVVFLCSNATGQATRSPFDRFAPPHPCTIRGKATDSEGKPVADATICVMSNNRMSPGGVDPVVGKTTTDASGNYILRDVPVPVLGPDGGPIKKYSEGVFQVFGTAAGYGFTWHPNQSVRPEQRPADANTGPNVFFAGEECVADLVFDRQATVEGQIKNDRGQPLADVKIELGYVHDVARPGGLASSQCTYLGSTDVADDLVSDSFSGMGQLSAESRSAVTDAEGRYKITGLRRETRYGLLIDYRPESDPLQITIATTAANKGRADRRVGYDGRVDHAFVEPRTVNVRITAAAGNQPLAGVTVRSARERLLRGGNTAQTNADGIAALLLPPGAYLLMVEPPAGASQLPAESKLNVAGEPAEQSATVTLDPAATIRLAAVEADSNKPLAGVSFLQETASGRDRRELHTSTLMADYPVTDERGELRAVLPPEGLRIIVDRVPDGYEAVKSATELIALAAGKEHVARFEFRRLPARAVAENAEPQDELRNLRALLAKQRAISKSGTYRIRQALLVPANLAARGKAPAEDLTIQEIRRIMDSWDQAADPDLFDHLNRQFPAGRLRTAEATVVSHGEKHRVESSPVNRISVSNGHENVVYDGANAQASLSPAVIGTTRQSFGPSPSVFYTLPSVAYRRLAATADAKPEVSREDGNLIIQYFNGSTREVIDEQTGFLHHSVAKSPNGFGRENWYFAPRKFENGVVMAATAVQTQFTGDKLTMFHAYQLEDAKLETPPAQAFVVSAPAGTNVVDFRQNRQQPKSQRVNFPVADVVMVANRISDDSRSILPVLRVGQPAPPLDPIAWLNANGQTQPPEQKGKVVLIDFWGVSCGPCVAELSDVQTLATEFANKNFLLIGLHESSGEVEEVAEFARKRALTYQLAIDRPAADSRGFGATYKAYGVQGIPSCAVIDQQGKIAYIGRFQEAAVAAAKLLDKSSK